MRPTRTMRPTRFAHGLTVLLAMTMLSAPLRAWTISGHVQGSDGLPIHLVDLDVEDRNTGQILLTPTDTTNVNGDYSIANVPTGDYRVYFTPPAGSHYFPDKVDQSISSNRTIDMTLQSGTLVSGFVKDQNGQPLSGIDLNFYDSASGSNVGVSGDNTDLAGHYSVLVNPGTYDILYRAPAGDPHVAQRFSSVSVGDSEVLRSDVVMPAGTVVTGFVKRQSNNSAVFDANMDCRTSDTHVDVVLGFDATDTFGSFALAVPAGTYDFSAIAPSGSGLANNVAGGIVVSGSSKNIGTIFLPNAVTLQGTVVDGANVPVLDANLDVRDPARGGIEIPTSGDHTDASGHYATLVGTGTYDLVYWPPAGMAAASTVIRNRVISGSTTMPNVQLLPGFVISGHVTKTGGAPVSGADLDAIQTSDGFLFPTLGDKTDAAGAYSIRVPAGTYRFTADGPAGSGLVSDTVVVTVSANTVIDFELFDPTAVGVGESPAAAAGDVWMAPASPNPTTGAATVLFRVPATATDAALSVFTSGGSLVRSLDVSSAHGAATWDGRDARGMRVPRGVYLLRLSADARHAVSRVVVVR